MQSDLSTKNPRRNQLNLQALLPVSEGDPRLGKTTTADAFLLKP
jgi:hypothetical protein